MSTGANSTSGTGGGRTKLPPFAAALIGTTIEDRFRIDKAIGQGAMGTVFAATQLSVNRRVAVKILREEMSETSKARFLREARAISSLSHPNIVQLVDFGERDDDHLLYLVMEFVEGLRMSRLNRKGRLHPNLVIELTSQICGALAEAHAQGIIHRDLKPSNILLVLSADGSVQLKVLDFGVAHTYEDAAELTATGVLCGTPAYMAPEQASGTQVTPRVDLYALGINMYEMLVGFRPFSGGSPIEVAMRQIQTPPPTLRGWMNEGLVPPPLVELCESLLAKDPAARPASASELRQRLLAIRSELGWGPIVIKPSEDPWEYWTLPKLANHGAKPLDEDAKLAQRESGSWSGSWGRSGMDPHQSQVAMQGNSGPRLSGSASALNHVPAHDISVSQASLPSRHGGGWDAFRDITGSGPQVGHGQHLGPAPSGPHAGALHPDDTASPSAETAYIYEAAHSGVQPSPAGHHAPGPQGAAQHHHGTLDRGAEMPAVPGPATYSTQSGGQPARPQAGAPASAQTTDFIEPTSASFEGVWRTDHSAQQNPTFADAKELSVERRPEPRGTVVGDLEPSGLSNSDLFRFGIVAVLVFLICAAIGAVLLFPEKLGIVDPVAAPVIDEVVTVPADTEEPPVEAEEPDEKKSAKKKVLKKKKKKDWDEPIDLFGDSPAAGSDDGEPKKLVIERDVVQQ